MDIINKNITTPPLAQNAIDIFQGEWSCSWPDRGNESIIAGKVAAFDDPRMHWANQNIPGGIKDREVLELGPLEAAHTYMLEKFAAKAITSIEANRRAFLKSLIIKEIYHLQRSQFLLGDFNRYLETSKDYFDICIASGVLYHMENPVKLLSLIAQHCNNVMLWTHYYDEVLIKQNDNVRHDTFVSKEVRIVAGFKHHVHKRIYADALGWSGFCGAAGHYSMWMTRSDIIASLQYFGFDHIIVGLEQPTHDNGPCFCIAAKK